MRPERSRLAVPLVVSVALFITYYFFPKRPMVIGPVGDLRQVLFGRDLKVLHFLAWAALIFFIVRFVDNFVFDVVLSRRRRVAAPLLLRQMVSIGLYLILFGLALSEILHAPIGKLLTTGTVVAAVVGLALQETLGNLFAGISLHMEDAFDVGDVIHSGDYIGVVEGVTWRTTRIRAFNNQLVILPNSLVARERLEIFVRNQFTARILTVAIDYHVPPATVIEILKNAASHVEGVAREMPCFSRVGGFADSAVVYEIKYFTRDYSLRDRIDADIRKAVWYALRRAEVSFAFPVRTYQEYKPPQSATHEVTPDEILDRMRDVDVLSPLSEASHEALARATKVHFYSKGEAILRHGTDGDSMFVLHDGTVSVRVVEEGEPEPREVARLSTGSVFGEMALLTGEARTADVVAVTDVTALEIGKASLEPILHSHPELAAAISAKVLERRDNLAPGKEEEEEQSILSRIRNYFSL
ncbi:MAG: mechanosensitive ion channel/cyclic nucleotide-binding protein [Acidobacteria bacterium]|nr:mechanosensitive ion channel/cyclic nucleotide-binding protein [Acidobacteriota bacterium]